jgi:hypothetical protein
MKVSEMFPSSYLRAVDIPPRGITLVIEDLTQEEANSDGAKVKKHALRFRDENRLLILNKSNAQILEAAFGDSDNWPGRTITLSKVPVIYMGSPTDGIRVSAVDFDDDINDLISSAK